MKINSIEDTIRKLDFFNVEKRINLEMPFPASQLLLKVFAGMYCDSSKFVIVNIVFV